MDLPTLGFLVDTAYVELSAGIKTISWPLPCIFTFSGWPDAAPGWRGIWRIGGPFFGARRLCLGVDERGVDFSLMTRAGSFFPGLDGLNKPIVWVFPKIEVCLSCGAAEFVVPESEQIVLRTGHRVEEAVFSEGSRCA